MNVTELYSLTIWISGNIEKVGIPNFYQELHTVLQQHSQNQRQTQIEPHKDKLIKALDEVPIVELTRDQFEFLHHLGLADLVGKTAIDKIEDLLYRNVIDVATSAKEVQEMHTTLVEGVKKSNQILGGLKGCVPEESYQRSDEVLMRVTFDGDASLRNVTEFKSWGSTWYDIARGVAMAHEASPEDVHVIGATKGSIVIELSAAAAIAGTVSGIILSALKVAEKVLDIRKKAEELRGLQLKNDKLAADIAKAADDEKKSGIDGITDEMAQKIGLNGNGEGDKVSALKKAVKNLVEFIEKGGVVDFVAPASENEAEEDEYGDLRVSFEEIRRLEKKLHGIEHKTE